MGGHVDAVERVPDTQAMERGVREQVACLGIDVRDAGDGSDVPAWITASDAARVLGVRTGTVYKLIETGRLRAHRPFLFSGGRIRVSVADVADYDRRPRLPDGRRAWTQRNLDHETDDPASRPLLGEISTLGERVRALRRWRSLSLATVAAAVTERAAATDGPALDRGHLSRIENGHVRAPGRRLLAHLAAVLHVTEDELLAGLEIELYPAAPAARALADPSSPPPATGTETLGERVRTLRRRHKLTQAELAAAVTERARPAGRGGLSLSHLNRLENGRQPPPKPHTLAHLAAVLQTTEDDLLAHRGRASSRGR